MRKLAESLLAMAMFAAVLLPLGPLDRAEATSQPRVGVGPREGTSKAAAIVLNEKTCPGLTVNRLTALMLSIPEWELLKGNTTYAPSPLSLSRGDGWADPKNHPLYSHGTYDGYRRAHWNPGVGLWQEDEADFSIRLNHGQRIVTSIGGIPVAETLRNDFCAGSSKLRNDLNGTWRACRPDKCWNTYNQIYVASNDSLNVVTDPNVKQWDGNVTHHKCRFAGNSNEGTFECRFINTARIEGFADTSNPEGQSAQTPLALPFLSFTTPSSKNKAAAWLRAGTGYDVEIVRWEPQTKNARYGGSWYNGTSLEVYKCDSSKHCSWSGFGLSP